MRQRKKGLALTVLAFAAASLFTPRAEARHSRSHTHRISHHVRHSNYRRNHGTPQYHHVIQCVAFANQSTGLNIRGNARDWWSHAAGVYDRSSRPERGAVLAFRPTRRMPLGHVAVVHSIIDNRTILIDQSHWASNGISRNVRVVDVSPSNDWSEVRVALNSNNDRLGSIYPAHGFIHPRAPSASSYEKRNNLYLAKANTISSKSEVASLPNDAKEFFDDDAPHRSLR